MKYEKGARENFGFNHELYKQTLKDLYPNVAKRRAVRRRQQQAQLVGANEIGQQEEQIEQDHNQWQDQEPEFFGNY